MSFSGYILYLCENGEIIERDCYNEFLVNICPDCGGKIIESICCCTTNSDYDERQTNKRNYDKLHKKSDKILSSNIVANKIKLEYLDKQISKLELTIEYFKRDKIMVENKIKDLENIV